VKNVQVSFEATEVVHGGGRRRAHYEQA